MKIFVPKEADPRESRCAFTPEAAAKLHKLGNELSVESGLGAGCGYSDGQYTEAGATISTSPAADMAQADCVLRLNPPSTAAVAQMKRGALHISYVDPFNNTALVDAFAQAGVNAISMEMIPRTTLAQKMDALSSQANLAGYVAVILATDRLNKILPMMMTPAGTLKPAHVFIIGCGVAGLQAIATAKRLGARVEAFDTRPVVEEQVHSLGAKFVKVDLGETGQTKDGYAKELTEEQRAKQRDAMAKVVSQADIVITTAQLFGKKAPIIVTDAMVRSMRPGSVIVDLAIESGGNVEGARLDEEVEVNGVRILGLANLPGRVPVHASQMYSANLLNLIQHFWNKEEKSIHLKLEDEIMDGCLIVHDGALRSKMLLNARAQS
ncbi:MAG: Re/Si-specific NAD(P)(+) transhydrogenase subunit alpha [Candidatus Hydrogenedentes bacterium]|nr:Re/Si-specific NAD(P)(+) transhydrogenase subunit alpha [Candidatus Hydrogenedentota bacterium]